MHHDAITPTASGRVSGRRGPWEAVQVPNSPAHRVPAHPVQSRIT